MDQSFGTRLRLQREQQQVSLSAVAAKTKIKLSLLEGLERDDVSAWPFGIFRRAHIRAYAEAVGLESDAAVHEFLALYPDPVEVLPAGTTVWPDPKEELTRPQVDSGFRRLVTSVMTAVPTFLQRVDRSAPLLPVLVLEKEPAPEPAKPAGTELASQRTATVERERPGDVPVLPRVDLLAVAQFCNRVGRAQCMDEVAAVLRDASMCLDAIGLIVWCWDGDTTALKPLLAYGYSDATLARFGSIPQDEQNAVAAAFRSAEPCVVTGSDGRTGALVVPSIASGKCLGALALEFQDNKEQCQRVHAAATILAAQLVPWLRWRPVADALTA